MFFHTLHQDFFYVYKIRSQTRLIIFLEVVKKNEARLHKCNCHLIMPREARLKCFSKDRQLLFKLSIKIFITKILHPPPLGSEWHPLAVTYCANTSCWWRGGIRIWILVKLHLTHSVVVIIRISLYPAYPR